MKSRFLQFVLASSLLLFHAAGQAKTEDIDLFGGSSADSFKASNVMLVIDNAAAFSSSASGLECKLPDPVTGVMKTTDLSGTSGGVEQCALYNVIASLATDTTASLNIGVMVYNANGVTATTNSTLNPLGRVCNASKNGGCLVLPLTPLNNTTKPLILAWIAGWRINSGGTPNFAETSYIKSNGQATASAMQETWAYLYAKTGISGTNYAVPASGIPDTNCKNFVVFIGNVYGSNGTPGEGATTGGYPRAALDGTLSGANSGMNADPPATSQQKVQLNSTNSSTNLSNSCGTVAANELADNKHDGGLYLDEWARYMKTQRITTYTVGFIGAGCKAIYPWLLKSAADVSGGTYFAVANYAELVAALQNIFSEVRSVNSVFAAVSLPVSVNSQGTYLNQVFIGMFRPDKNKFPRWNGNLKQYKLGYDSSNNFNLLDADSARAISSSGSEFIAECARSFWTPPLASPDGYWTALDSQNCATYPAASNTPDGNIVEKGGQGYKLRAASPATRVVQTCNSSLASCQTTMTDFNTTYVTTTHLGVSASSHTAVVNWARGQNSHMTKTETAVLAGSTITTSSMRPSSHGDVVHSRPVAINMGTDAQPKVVVIYGSNDGVLKAINGNRTTTFTVNGSTPVEAGAEFWSFIPPEFYSKIARIYNNTQGIDTNSASGGAPKDYSLDGPIGAYRASNGDAYFYVNMRRGGRAIYAFKMDAVTLAISLVWKRGCASGTDCYTGFNEIGQTWSAPTLFTARGYGGGTTPILMIGGGYDPTCEDADTCTAATQGNRIYVMNAIDGSVLQTFTTIRSVVADMTVVNGADGKADVIYTADMGGNVYRIQGASDTTLIGNTAPAASGGWTMTHVASLGCNSLSPATCTSPPNRKFMFAPDVVVDGSDYILLLGSGDREKPVRDSSRSSTANYFFMIRDRPETANWTSDTTNCGSSTTKLCMSSLLSITPGTTPSDSDLAAKKGWYLPLVAQEQVVTGAIAVFGTVYFTTHEPKAAATNACAPNLGTSRAYAVKYKNAGAARQNGDLYVSRDDAGLAPDLVVGKVTLDSGQTVPFCIGCEGPIKPSQPVPPGNLQNPAKIRSYWYIQK